MLTALDKFKSGDRGVVCKVTGEGAVRRRLFDLGITPGAYVIYRKAAPFGDPIEITVRGYELSIRLSEASAVIVDKEN